MRKLFAFIADWNHVSPFDMFVVLGVCVASDRCSCVSSQETAINALTTWLSHVQRQKCVFQ